MQHKNVSYCLVITTSGPQPGLLADMTASGAHPSSSPRLLQVKGTGCTLKCLSKANIPAGKQIDNTNRWQTTGQTHDDLTVQAQNRQHPGKSTHGWGNTPRCLDTDQKMSRLHVHHRWSVQLYWSMWLWLWQSIHDLRKPMFVFMRKQVVLLFLSQISARSPLASCYTMTSWVDREEPILRLQRIHDMTTRFLPTTYGLDYLTYDNIKWFMLSEFAPTRSREPAPSLAC